MSKLPPALAARLAKRGLIKNETDKPKQSEVLHEEVIAEDYDDSDTNKFEILESKPLCETVIGCPNKSNIYHNCTDYCAKKYADVSLKPTKILRRQFQILLERFPLKDSVWEQIYEPGLKTFYFWNTVTDQVSWLPPSHPDAKISLPAEKLRSNLRIFL
ncbi:hypothetical protein QR98_0003670 [Sarcoptes scabiei]|uniref:Uncharacterized protein n=1 Tax=Sarcoptes scabiei TaxID=52283 RepID=A0A131ZT98_SARSC|nr:hypothetical protein QR98_0003670 [Sarcoptes scabiei]